jgi:hypothetical protein
MFFVHRKPDRSAIHLTNTGGSPFTGRTNLSPKATSHEQLRCRTICLAVILPQRGRSSALNFRSLSLVSDNTSGEARLFIPPSPQSKTAQP